MSCGNPTPDPHVHRSVRYGQRRNAGGPARPAARPYVPAWTKRPPCLAAVAAVEWRTPESGIDPADWLSPEEHIRHATLPDPSRRRQWLMARVALKWRLLRDERLLDPRQATIRASAGGQPHVHVRHAGGGAQRLFCSLSHADGRVLAAYAAPADGLAGLGLDLMPETCRLGDRMDAFSTPADDVFAASAQRQATVLWCMKEATGKALGIGFSSRYRLWRCKNLRQGRFAIRIPGRRLRLLGVFHAAGGWVRVIVTAASADQLTATGMANGEDAAWHVSDR